MAVAGQCLHPPHTTAPNYINTTTNNSLAVMGNQGVGNKLQHDLRFTVHLLHSYAFMFKNDHRKAQEIRHFAV